VDLTWLLQLPPGSRGRASASRQRRHAEHAPGTQETQVGVPPPKNGHTSGASAVASSAAPTRLLPES
jgi:hypothetical protein